MPSFRTRGMRQLERVITLSGALLYKGHLYLAWSRGSTVYIYMYSTMIMVTFGFSCVKKACARITLLIIMIFVEC